MSLKDRLLGVFSSDAPPTSVKDELEQYAAGIVHSGTMTIPGNLSVSVAILSPGEVAELDNLEQEHQHNTKIAMLEVFKALPREFRQFVVNIYLWEDAIKEIERSAPPEPLRLNELKVRKLRSNPLGLGFSGMGHHNYNPFYSTGPIIPHGSLPSGLSKDDLVQAHMSASMEEELKGG